MARKAGPRKPGDFAFDRLAGRSKWPPLPAVIALAGEARFLRKHIERRVVETLFRGQPVPALARFDALQGGDDLLARVLDELRTVSILSEARLVIVENADEFLAGCRDDLEPFLESGFAGGHLVLHLERAPDARTRFATALLEKGWVVRCKQPFDRPPPWQPGTPPWENELTQWIVSWALHRGLEIDARTAYELQARVGTDLGVLDESLEKIGTYLGPERRQVDLTAIEAVTGELREDSVFDLVESFIARDRARAIHMAEKLFVHGYRPPRSAPVHDSSSIAIMFIGALAGRLRPLRRAHAMRAAGHGPDAWLEQRLTTRPFIERFRRELAAMPPARIERAFDSLLRLDRAIKTGADPRLGVAILLARD